MEKGLTVDQDISDDRPYEIRETINGERLSLLERKRLLSHIMADITHRILSNPSPDPTRLTVTVEAAVGSPKSLVVTATCYQLTEARALTMV